MDDYIPHEGPLEIDRRAGQPVVRSVLILVGVVVLAAAWVAWQRTDAWYYAWFPLAFCGGALASVGVFKRRN